MKQLQTVFVCCLALILLVNGNVRSQDDGNEKYPDKPKLVVGIVIDQMRYDFLDRFKEDFGEKGFKRLLEKGYSFKNTNFDYMPTFTGPGHASIFTGTTPAHHGIIGNDWYMREGKRSIYVTTDADVNSIGTRTDAGKMSPHRLLGSTIGDELRLHNNRRSKVIAISLKDRGSILPAGHLGDAYWFDKKTGNFITSSWYRDELPSWVRDFNNRNLTEKYVNQPWELFLSADKYDESIEDDNPYEDTFKGEGKPVFPHNLPELVDSNGKGMIATTPFGNTLVKKLAYKAVKKESLGADQYTDLLSVSFSSTDYVGHKYAPASKEVQDTYLRLDRQIAEFLTFLDKNIGMENVLVFVTSDHGAAHNPAYLKDQGVPAGYFDRSATEKDIRGYLKDEYGEDLLLSFSNYQVFLDRKRIREMGLDLDQIQRSVSHYLLGKEGVAGALTGESLRLGEFSRTIRRKVQRGYHQKRSGDVAVWLKPQWINWDTTGTTHGSPFTYSTRVPLIWYGWTINGGKSTAPVYVSDIASTLSVMLGIPFPSANTGKPMNRYMK